MQRVRARLDRIKQDSLLIPTTSKVGIIPKQLIEAEYHVYLENYQDREQVIHEHAMYVD